MSRFNNKIYRIKHKDLTFFPQLGKLIKGEVQSDFFEYIHELKPIDPQHQENIEGIIFIVTTDCNLNCEYCYSKRYREKGGNWMSTEQAKKTLEYYIKQGKEYLIINFFGGEPTLHTDFLYDIVNFLETQPINSYLRISTNGLIDYEILDYLIDKNFNFVVSSDGKPGLDGNHRGEYKTTKEIEGTIRYLVNNDALFRVRTTISSRNINKLSTAIKYWNELGVEFVAFEPINPYGKALKGSTLIPEAMDYVEMVKEVILEAEERKMWVISSPFTSFLAPTRSYCSNCSGKYRVFNPDGSISSCLRVQGKDESLDKFTIGRYLNGKVIIQKDKQIELKSISVDSSKVCKSCEVRYLCGGGCPMRNFLHTGSFLIPDQWECIVKKNLIFWGIERLNEYINENVFPSVLGQFVWEKRVFSEPSIGNGSSILKKLKVSKEEVK